MNKKASEEFVASSGNGFAYVGIGIIAILAGAGLLLARPAPATALVFVLGMLVGAWCLAGLYMLQPNQAALLTLFGSYRGTDRNEGLRWANPFYVKRKISVRARNFNSEKLKVNDKRGNPIEIAAAIVWKIDETATATSAVA